MCIGEEGRIILFFSFISYRIVTILLLLSTYVYRLYILYIYICVCISIFPSFFFLFANYLSIIFTWIERIFKQFVRKAWLA